MGKSGRRENSHPGDGDRHDQCDQCYEDFLKIQINCQQINAHVFIIHLNLNFRKNSAACDPEIFWDVFGEHLLGGQVFWG